VTVVAIGRGCALQLVDTLHQCTAVRAGHRGVHCAATSYMRTLTGHRLVQKMLWFTWPAGGGWSGEVKGQRVT
jgi:hypothetical protein